MKPRRLLTILASFGVSAVFLALALYSVDFGKLARAFAAADYRLVVGAGLLTFTGYVARTARWQRFVAPSKLVSIPRLFPVLVVGFALNNLLPGRPGEFARAYALGQREGLSKTLGFGTVVVERVMDGLALIAFFLAALAAFSPLGLDLPAVAETIVELAALLFGVALAGLFFLLFRENVTMTLFRRITGILPRRIAARLERMLASFVLGLHSLRSIGDLAAIALLSLAVWCCEGTAYWLMLTAFGALPSLPVRAVAAAFMMVIINLGVMIPAAPGGLGPFEAAGVFALGAFAIDETTAASVALAAHAVQYLLVTGLGAIFVWREGISLAQARAEAEETK